MLDRVSLAISAVGRAASDKAGRTDWEKLPHLATGNQSNCIAKTYCRIDARIKLGTEIQTTASSIVLRSCHLPLLKAAYEPSATPMPIAMNRASSPKVDRKS